MKNIHRLFKIAPLALLILLTPALLLSCGKSASDSTGSGGISAIPADTSVEKSIGAFLIKVDKTSVDIGQNASITITPPNTERYGHSLSTTSNATVTAGDALTSIGGTISLGSANTTRVKIYPIKGRVTGQIISVTVGITGYVDKAVFKIEVR